MQIQNFYSDPIPSVRNPLDSIVLSPHTIRTHDINLAELEDVSNGYQSLLPSLDSCQYHDQDACLPPAKPAGPSAFCMLRAAFRIIIPVNQTFPTRPPRL